jgi:dihydroorotate dehydrogenase electron transfer subunit
VCALADRYAIPVQALVTEPTMTCGTGLCMGCVLPTVGNDGITRMARACVDGPVFRGDVVRWDDVGTIPFDALGAPGWKPRPGAPASPASPASAAPAIAPTASSAPDGPSAHGTGGERWNAG